MSDEDELTGAAGDDLSDDAPPSEPVEEDTAAETDENQSGLQAGDFIRLDYTAYTVEGEQLVDTTDPDVAEEEGVDEEGQTFEPRTVVLGEGHIFEPVEQAIIGGEVGDTGTVTVGSTEAFGEHNPDEVETISSDKIDEDDRYPGAHVHIDGRHGYINTIVGGRARVDFNHPLAGEDIEYEYEILSEVEDREERAAGLFEMYLDMEPELWIQTDEVEEPVPVDPESEEGEDDDDEEDTEPEMELVEKESLYIEATPQMSMNQQWLFSKQQIADEIIDAVDVDRIVVQEILEGAGPMGMPGMMGGMGGGEADIESALEDADIDAEEVLEDLEAENGE
ncbi:MAG: peptidylprolyl isomerase [Natrialbaceae archaeon]|nr:peptidylprolyl isomerase [Natrialbaceae archaeon]